MQTNIFAYTANDPQYPEYLSVNERNGRVEVTARGPRTTDARLGGQPMVYSGPTSTMTLPEDQIPMLIDALRRYMTTLPHKEGM